MQSGVVVGRWIKDRGREVRACRPIKRGTPLFEARPFAAALCMDNLTTHCSHCFLPLDASPTDKPANRCGECHLYTLCGTCAADSEQRVAVFTAHCESGECAILSHGELTDTTSRILLQIWHARVRDDNTTAFMTCIGISELREQTSSQKCAGTGCTDAPSYVMSQVSTKAAAMLTKLYAHRL